MRAGSSSTSGVGSRPSRAGGAPRTPVRYRDPDAAPATLEIDPARFDAVIFDMDGVITDTATVHARAWKRMFDAYLRLHAGDGTVDVTPFSDDDYRRHVDGRQRQDGVGSFLTARGIHLTRGAPDDPPERETLWGLANRKDREFRRIVAQHGVDAFPTSVALVRSLQRHGVGTAIVSASRNRQLILDAAGIGTLFAVGVDGVDAETLNLPGKPEPALFLEAARRLGAMPARSVVVEDALAGVEAGRRGLFGLVIGIDRGAGENALLAAGADVVVADLGAVRVRDAAAAAGASGDAGLPEVPSGWSISVEGFDPHVTRAREALFTVCDGRVGARGAAVTTPGAHPWAGVLGVYTGDGAETRLLSAPLPPPLRYEVSDIATVRRILDLRAGVVHEVAPTAGGTVATTAFASLAHPGTIAIRTRGPQAPPAERLLAPSDDPAADEGSAGPVEWMRVAGTAGGIAAAAVEDRGADAGGHRVDRFCAYAGHPEDLPDVDPVVRAVRERAGAGFDALLMDQRRAWAARWSDADIVIEGDESLQAATRFVLLHVMASVPDRGEAAVGARGLSGPGYRGHVFWDSDTFVLPFLAATHPSAARSMLEYRLRRLPAAMEAARRAGRRGARFPWESAASGVDVTPLSARDRAGHLVPIRTGQLEEHIVAQIAWAACCYLDWTGDEWFARGDGLRLLVETARWWASRVTVERDGSAHIYGIIGPDEYHEPVDDNAFTNVMARWNLRRAADAVEAPDARTDVEAAEAERWRALAGALVDGYDPDTGVYEQFAGFYRLEPLIIEEVAPRRPIAADLLLGPARVHGAQVLKQADVLMLHHLVPDAVAPDSLEPNLRFYEPRTAHGSSLSPAIHASLFARTRDFTRALAALRMATRIDLDDLTGTTADGLHLATMGGVWQAFAYGFFGLRPLGDALAIDPLLPPSWGALEIRVRFRGSRVWLRKERRLLLVRADPAVNLAVGNITVTATPGGVQLEPRNGAGWRCVR